MKRSLSVTVRSRRRLRRGALGGFWHYREGFYLDLREILEQALYFNKSHRRIVFAHELAVSGADVANTRLIFFLIGNEDQQSRDVFRRAACFPDDRENILESLRELFGKIIAYNALFGIPTHLTGYEQERSSLDENTVVVAARLSESLGIDHVHVRCLRGPINSVL